MFRSLIYRTDFGNTIIREEFTATPTLGANEAFIFTDFVIPANQPLYLWRESTGSVIPNTEQNVNDWLEFSNPPSGDDEVTYNVFTGYTATTQVEIDNKIDKVTGATTGNVPTFTADGGLEDSGFAISDLTGSTTGSTGGLDLLLEYRYNSGGVTPPPPSQSFRLNNISPSAATEIYIDDITITGADASYVLDKIRIGDAIYAQDKDDANKSVLYRVTSGAVDNTGYFTVGVTQESNGGDLNWGNNQVFGLLLYLFGDNKLDFDAFTGYTATTEVRLQGIESDITYISGETASNDADIAYISGQTDTKLDITDFNTYTGDTRTELDLTITGATNGLTKAGRNVRLGGELDVATEIITSANTLTFRGAPIQYFDDYSGTFNDRSLVDKAYVDTVAAGLDPKDAVNVATTTTDGNIDLTGGTFGGSIDGITVVDGWRVLIKEQTDASENGIYDYSGGSNTFIRSEDFDGTPTNEVTSGAFTTVVTGNTLAATSWVVTTPDPITVGTTDINFTLLSAPLQYTGGVGIIVSGTTIIFDGAAVAGQFLQWDGLQLNVTGLTSLTDFAAYTATTETRISGIEDDITYISGETASNDADIAFLSGVTDQNTSDIAALSGSSVSIDTFTGYTATTDVRITDVENDITFLSGATDQNTTDITNLTNDFTGFTASTQSNELFIIHTGGTDINTVINTAIDWDLTEGTVGSAYNYTGGSGIFIQETGEYEVTYNVPFTQAGNNNDRGIGTNLVLNSSTILDNTAGAGYTSRSDLRGAAVLATVNLSLTAGDRLDLICFRTGQAGVTNTAVNVTLLLKKKNTLQ